MIFITKEELILLRETMSNIEAAKSLGISHSSFARLCRDAKVPPKSPGRQKGISLKQDLNDV